MDVVAALEQIDELTRAINEVDLSSLTDAELHDATIRAEAQTGPHAAMRARLVRGWDTSKAWADNGSLSAGARLTSEIGCDRSTASAECRRGRKLALMPIAAAALAAGEISVDAFDALARCNTGRFRDLFAEAEAALVDIARVCRFSELRQHLTQWRLTADALCPGTRDRKQDEDRRLHASRTFDGTVAVNGVLTPVGGEIFLNELERLTRDLYAEDRAEAKERLGRAPQADELRRDHAQRRHDALVEMATRSAAMPADAQKPAPLFSILWGADAFRAALCETEHGIVLSPDQVLPYLTAAEIERIVFGPGSRVIDVGRRQRLFTGATRRAVQVRDRTCRHPAGCDTPAPRCEVDHIIPYSAGGETTQDNGRLHCDPHNRGRHKPHDTS